MKILDGKNHRSGVYEEFARAEIVRFLNTGGQWGRFDHEQVAKGYTPEELRRADIAFLATLRALVDQWVDSGISENGIDTPSGRDVRGLPKGYSKSLFDILHGWLSRNMPKPALMNDGKIAILDRLPEHYGLEAEVYAREMAIYYFKELLECPAPHRLGRCQNPRCRSYFNRKRERKGDIKRGTYCGRCELIGAAERTRVSRQHKKNQQLDAAAKALPQWKKSTRHPNQSEWVARQVNKQFPSGTQIQAKWVTQNRKEILERVDAAHL